MGEKIYIYSGIEMGKKGAGNLVSFFVNKLNEKKIDFELICYNTPDGKVIKILTKLGLKKLLKSFYYKIFRNISKVNIQNAKVVLFHPQSIGLNIVSNLIKKNKIYFYVFDNFLFCKKSYNYIQGNSPCIECIDNKKAHIKNKCTFFPNNQVQEQYDAFLDVIEQNLKKIVFLTQNKKQSELLIMKFGDDININQIGMMIDLRSSRKEINNDLKEYDFLYHNTLTEAKGMRYFLDLAKEMNEYSFAIPYTKQQVRSVIPDLKYLKNLDFLSVTWDTGLLEILTKSKIVLNPSLWSAPVEGALLKSIQYNGCVAVVDVNYSFQQEIPDSVLIKLPKNIQTAKEILYLVINSEKEINRLKKNSKDWLVNYNKNTELLFDVFLSNKILDLKN
jgi:hypothetical protein